MFIKKTIIEGVEGDVEIERSDHGAIVRIDGIEEHVDRNDPKDIRFGVAFNVAKVLCGTTRDGEPNASNSMIHDVLAEIDRVAGA